jgi:hypothetical protein
LESTLDIFAYFFVEGALPVKGVDVPLYLVHDQLLLFLPRSVLPFLGKNFQPKGEIFWTQQHSYKSGVPVLKMLGLFFEEKFVDFYLLYVLNN